MRAIVALVLAAACSKAGEPPEPTARPTTPEPPESDAKPGISSPAKPAPIPQNTGFGIANERCPVGDGTNVAVYDFLVSELAKTQRASSRDDTRRALREEAETLKDPTLKPPRASLVESPLSHALGTLCRGAKGCVAIGLYDRHGLAIAVSSIDAVGAPTYGFADDARWNAVTAAAHEEDGGVLPLDCAEAKAAQLACDDRHELVVFPVRDGGKLLGLASCIVTR